MLLDLVEPAASGRVLRQARSNAANDIDCRGMISHVTSHVCGGEVGVLLGCVCLLGCGFVEVWVCWGWVFVGGGCL